MTWSPEVFIRETEQEIIDAGTRSFWGEPAESWRAGNLVGTPGGGWDVAKYLLTHERAMIGAIGDRAAPKPLGQLCMCGSQGGMRADGVVRPRPRSQRATAASETRTCQLPPCCRCRSSAACAPKASR